MSGAYVAKPAVVTPPPSWPLIPIGWNSDWSFPGPNPPGYVVPSTVLSMSSDATVAVGGEVSASAVWMADTEDGPAGLPDGEWTQVWSAKIGDSLIGMAKSGDTEFGASLEFNYTDVDGYFGASDSVTFDISEANEGQTITLSVASFVDGEIYEDSVSIVVEAAPNTNYVRFSVSMPSVFGVTGTLTVTTNGGSATTTIGGSATSGSGVFASTSGLYVTVSAEDLILLEGATVSGSMSATNTKSLSKHVDGTVAASLYDEAGNAIIGASTVTQFDIDVAGYGSGEDSKACFQFALDDLIQL